MDSEEKFRLQRNRRDIVDNLRVVDIIDDLISDDILNSEDVQTIDSKTTTQDKVRCLLDILPIRGRSAYPLFRRALRRDYQYLVDGLDATDLTLHLQQNAPKIKVKPPMTDWLQIAKVASEDTECLKDWCIFARALGIPENDIVCIKHDFANSSLKEKLYQIILKWKSRSGVKGTPENFAQNVRSYDFKSIADKIEGYE